MRSLDNHTSVPDHREAWLSGLLLLIMVAGYAVLETARDSLFLARLPVSQLPLTYAAVAIAALLAAELNHRVHAVLGHRLMLTLTLVAGGLGDLMFMRLFRAGAAWTPHAFFVWTAVIATIGMAQFWLLVSEFFTVLQAKQRYAMMSAGGLLGAMLGGGLARSLAPKLGILSLLTWGAGLLFAAALIPAFRYAPARNRIAPTSVEVQARAPRIGEQARDLVSERYLQRLLALTVLSTLAATLADYVLKLEVARSVPTARLGSFFGTFNMSVSAVALLVQLAIAPWLLRIAGLGRSLVLLPGLLSVASLGVVLLPGFLSALLLRGTDASLRPSVHRGSVEVLYLPLSAAARGRWKMLVEVLGQRGGQALAGLMILGCIAVGLTASQMGMLLLVIALGWAALSATMERDYVSLFRAKVKAGAIETRAGAPALDLRSLETLVAALSSENDDEVLATVELLTEYGRTHLIPSLLLYHPSRAVVVRTLEIMSGSGRQDFVGAARRLLERDDEELRAAAMLALAGQMQPDELRRELNRQLPTTARAAVLVALLARGLDTDGDCAREVDAGCEPGADRATRLAFARAFRLHGGEICIERLPRLSLEADHELQIETARAMRVSPSELHVPALLRMLGHRSTRAIAREALVVIGEPALGALARAFEDVTLPRQTRAHLPRSISRFQSKAAADILLDRLEGEPDGWVRFKIIRGLGQLREYMRHPVRVVRLLGLARKNLQQAVGFLGWQHDTQRDQAREPQLATVGGQLLSELLRDKSAHATDRAVRLVALMHSADVSHNIRQALASQDERLRADGVELLIHDAPQDVAQALAAMLEPGQDKRRLARAVNAMQQRPMATSYPQRLSAMLADDSASLRAVVMYHMRELGLDEPARPAESSSSTGEPSGVADAELASVP